VYTRVSSQQYRSSDGVVSMRGSFSAISSCIVVMLIPKTLGPVRVLQSWSPGAGSSGSESHATYTGMHGPLAVIEDMSIPNA
jgi:hypothetical protein